MEQFIPKLTDWKPVFSYVAPISLLLAQGALLHPYYESNPAGRTLRALLAPLIIMSVVVYQKERLINPLEDWLHVNYCWVTIPTFHMTCLAIQYALHRGPARKVDAVKHKKAMLASSDSESDQSSSSITNSDSQAISSALEPREALKPRGHAPHAKLDEQKKRGQAPRPALGELVRFSLHMTCSPRGLEYTWGPPDSVLRLAPEKSIARFAVETLLELILNQLAIIALCAFLLPVSVHPRGAVGWIAEHSGHQLPDTFLVRFLVRRLVYGLWGAMGYHLFFIAGCLFNLAELVFISFSHVFLPASWAAEKFDPKLYPPLFNNVPFRTSLTDFWAKGWHSVFRRDFISCGAEPIMKIVKPWGTLATKMAGLMGAMFMSGVMHEWGFSSATGEVDWHFVSTIFFLICGVGIVLEAIFRQYTGRRVGGVWGWLWCWGWLTFWGDMIIHKWLQKGAGTAGMRGTLEVQTWPLAKFLLPLGPALPDAFISKLSFE